MSHTENLLNDLSKAIAQAINQAPARSALRGQLWGLSSIVEKVSPSPAQPAGPSRIDLRGAMLALGLALADVLESGEIPADVWEELAASAFIIEDFLQPKGRRRAEAARLRAVVSAWTAAPRRLAA